MKINANDVRVGNLLNYENRLWVVLKTMHVQPGKGGAYMQIEMKDIKVGTKQNLRLRSAETIEKVQLEQKDFQYLYDNGDMVELMDQTSFEQVSLSKDLIGEQAAFLQEGMKVMVEYHGDEAIAIVLPDTVVMEVKDCEPVVKGQTAASSYKPAIMENNSRIMVPPFINVGDRIVIKIESSEYLERAK
jgi:elongation factor P